MARILALFHANCTHHYLSTVSFNHLDAILRQSASQFGHSANEGNPLGVVSGQHTWHNPCLFFKGFQPLPGVQRVPLYLFFPFTQHQLHGIGLNSKTGHLRQNCQINEVCGPVSEYPQYLSALAIKGISASERKTSRITTY